MLRVTLSTDKPFKKRDFRDVGANSAKSKPSKPPDISDTNYFSFSTGKYFNSWFTADFQTWKQATNNTILILYSRTWLVRSLLPFFRSHVSFLGVLKRKGLFCFSNHHSPDTGCHSQKCPRSIDSANQPFRSIGIFKITGSESHVCVYIRVEGCH